MSTKLVINVKSEEYIVQINQHIHSAACLTGNATVLHVAVRMSLTSWEQFLMDSLKNFKSVVSVTRSGNLHYSDTPSFHLCGIW